MKKRFISSLLSLLMLFFVGCSDEENVSKLGEGEGVVTISIKSTTGEMLGDFDRQAYIFSGEECVAVAHTDPGIPFTRLIMPRDKNYKLAAFVVKGDNYVLSQEPVKGVSTLADFITIKDFNEEIPNMFLGVSEEQPGQEKTQLEVNVNHVGSLLKAQVHDLNKPTTVKNIELTVEGLNNKVSLDGTTYSATSPAGEKKVILLENNGKGLFFNSEEGSVLFPTIDKENMNLTYKVNYNSGVSKEFKVKVNVALASTQQTNIYVSLEDLVSGANDKFITKNAEWGTPFFVDDITATSFILPDFKESFIYEIVKGTSKIGEVCRENIIVNRSSKPSEPGDQESLQLNVFYPNVDGVINYKNGYVLDNGGSVTWTAKDVIYKPGKLAPSATYIVDHGIIVAASEYVSEGEALPKIVKDERGIEKNYYPLVKIANQIWMQANLNATKYTNGDNIPQNNFAGETVAAYKQVDLNSSEAMKIRKEFGLLYTQKVAMKDNIAPEGWKVANSEDWKQMVDYLGYGGIMATVDVDSEWLDNNGNPYVVKGLCSFMGFSGLKIRGAGCHSPWGGFSNLRNATYFWGLTPEGTHKFYFYQITVSMEVLFGVGDFFGEPNTAISIRCMKQINQESK